MPFVSVSPPVLVGEGERFVDMVLRMDVASAAPLSLKWDLRNLENTVSADWRTTGGTVVFAPGETLKTVRLELIDDTVDEALELFSFEYFGVAAGTTASGAQTVQVLDNDGAIAVPQLFVHDATIDEKAGVMRFVVRLGDMGGGSLATPVTVAYSTADDTATDRLDYASASGTLTFLPGENVKTIDVTVFDDTSIESAERLLLTLADPSGAAIGDGIAIGTIGPSDGTLATQPRYSVTSATVGEGDGYADLVVTLASPAATPVTIAAWTPARGLILPEAIVAGGLAPVAVGGQLVFFPGETTRVLRVGLLDDSEPEARELNGVLLQNGSVGVQTLTATSVVVVDNDTRSGVPRIFVDDIVVDETTGTARFDVRLGWSLGQVASGRVQVDFRTEDRSAVAGQDYVAAAGRLSFAPGTSVQSVYVDLLNDTLAESAERFALVLSNPVNATLGQESAEAEIGLSDGVPLSQPTISLDDVIAGEGDTIGQSVLRLNAPSPNPISVMWGGAGIAREIADFVGPNSREIFVHFAPGQTTQVVPLEFVDDKTAEPLEIFPITLGTPTNALIGRGAASVTIYDNETFAAQPQLFIEDAAADERSGSVQFAVHLGGRDAQASSQVVSVRYGTTDVTAQANADYRGREGLLVFQPGETVQVVRVDLIDDTLREASERFRIELYDPVNATIGSARAHALIGPSDQAPVERPILSVGDASAGEADGYVDVVVGLSAPSPLPVGYQLLVTDALSGRLVTSTGNGGTLSFPAGETLQVVRLRISEDQVAEPMEHWLVTPSGLSNATAPGLGGLVAILDNDNFAETATLRVRDVVVDESSGRARFDVVLGGARGAASAEMIRVAYATRDGTAQAGQDYVPQDGVLVFAPGDTLKTVEVDLIDDAWPEPGERFELVLSGAEHAAVADGHGVALLGPNDTAPQARATLSVASAAVSESDGYVDLMLTLSNPLSVAVSLPTSPLIGGTASAGDLTLLDPATLFPQGATTASLRVRLVDDIVLEPAEVARLSFNAPTGITLPTSAVDVTIQDDDDLSRAVLSWGRSDDVYRPQSAADLIVESAGGGTDTLVTSWDVTLPAALENAWLLGTSPLSATGNASMNLLIGNAGNNRLDGQAGIDTAVFASTRAAATITGGTVATPLDGTDTLVSIERWRFADVLLASDTTPGGNTYLAYAMFNAGFNRGPDASELGRWTAQLDQLGNGSDLAQAMINFYAPGVPDDALVAHLWGTIVGTPITPADLATYVGLIRNGTYTQASLLELVATLPMNTVEIVGIVGQTLAMDPASFPLPA
ncbi:MAG: hypothetical protein JNN18_03310 [Rubrivivax sp.]|nr:hypothetical protein [Rubrivivax sp.]